MKNKNRIVYGFEDYVVDSGRIGLLRNGKSIAIAPTLFQVLLVFLERPGQILTRDDLFAVLWPGKEIAEATIAHNVAELRRVLGGTIRDQRFIETFPRFGYRFSSIVRKSSFHDPEDFNALIPGVQEMELDHAALSTVMDAPDDEIENRVLEFCKFQGLLMTVQRNDGEGSGAAVRYRLERRLSSSTV